MSFKYRFILSFVSLEIFFILLIVSINFFAINSLSKQLTQQKIESNTSLLEELVKVPISIYDLATLDNLLTNSSALKNINSIIILDNQDRILSSQFGYKYKTMSEIIELKANESVNYKKESYEIKYLKIFDENIFLGSMYIIFDTSENSAFIKSTQENTFYLIFLEIFISTLLSYIIGNGLTKKLVRLSETAKEIGENNSTIIPYTDKKDEIGILANSLNQMQIDLENRNNKLKTLASTLNYQKNELIEIQKYKDNFFANMSHELKTPLNSINLLSSLMKKNKDGTLDSTKVRNLEIINNCGKNLLFLINDILDISKLEAGELVVNNVNFDFRRFIYEIKDMFSSQIENKNLEFLLNYDDEIININNDKKIINQVILNLISNAIKFTDSGKIILSINNKNNFIEIIVEDEGIGIPNDKLEHIFDRFKQVDGSISRKYGGTGLGLAICKELVSLLNGKISVKSYIGKGSIFTVEILKNIDEKNTTNKNEVLSYIREDTNLKQLENKSYNTHKEKNILILNKDTLKFLDIVVELKRKYKSVEQCESWDKFKNKLLTNDYFVLIVDLTIINEFELKEILSKELESKLIIICEDKNSIDIELINKANNVYEKPIIKAELLSSL